MTDTVETRLASIDQGLTEASAGVAILADQLRLQGEMLSRILEILTPVETEQSGPSLHELMAQLIGRLDRQSVMLKDILVSQGTLARDLPLDVVRAIDDNYGAAGSGQANGGTPQP